MDNMEIQIFKIISKGGNAKGLVYEAINEAEEGRFAEAEKLLVEADSELKEAHQVQTSLIQDEIAGKHCSVSLLLVHAQDHLMTAMEVRALADIFIRNSKRLFELEAR